MSKANFRGVGLLLVLALLFVPRPVLGAPTLTVSPSSGPAGTLFVVTGTGFKPSEPLFYRVVGPAGSANTPSLVPFLADEDGSFRGNVDSAGRAPGDYRLEVLNGAGAVTVATFTITGGAAPTPPPPSPPTGGPTPPPPPSAQCFEETGQCIQGRFLAYWQAHGGLAINGYPISDEMRETLEDGQQYTVQYFERVRMEYHPENDAPYDVLLGQFGRRIHPADPPAAQAPGARYFSATGHNLGGSFRAYWEANGDLAQFGYPLTEEITERLEDGNEYRVQYFERARFEHHPENPDPQYQVLLGQFGRRILSQR
ncbi:MAG: hypothetical protein AVDCRST_MAG18-1176 [uncultured Thermomicrobiales bacterium]|uniref:IPT/TIG domain-containing protein n=1 Tax=uncultured Thermomicrobiales bacterium TaxID=1645740 RepID=A0A6J4UZ75_9BACT|nr:MAG: hypothetical protein AVDCRST_MAG18-1176 [uncultured Thermomicrobiales bacterium]